MFAAAGPPRAFTAGGGGRRSGTRNYRLSHLDDIPLAVLFGALVLLLILSAFFSSSETGLMSLNRYRLRHLAQSGHRGAALASRLLERPDRLIGLILLGNNFVNILASSLATIIALRLMGEAGIAVAAGLLTMVLLIFSEVAPKTLAALHPERIAFPAAWILAGLMRLLWPLVWVVNALANLILHPLGVRTSGTAHESLSPEELRTVVLEGGTMIPQRHRRMLLSILDLQEAAVEDIMVPRNEVAGIDLSSDWDETLRSLTSTEYTRLLVYRDTVDNVVGFLHVRKLVSILAEKGRFDPSDVERVIREPYFIPEGTPLNVQLINFQKQRRRIGLVVDEYGDLLGLVTLEDILEEIVGEFTTDPATMGKDVQALDDGGYLVAGSAAIRSLNRRFNLHLPVDGPRTINGLIMEYLEALPERGRNLQVAGYPIEIVDMDGNRVKTARISKRH
jgi:Mg2+/Co2+ transporter CorB